MNTDATPLSTAELLMHLALGYHETNRAVPDSQERIRKGFNAIVAALRQVDAIPAADIDAFVQSVQSGSSQSQLRAPVVQLTALLPDETFYSALEESGMLDGLIKHECEPPAHHPKFQQAMERIKELQEAHGQAAQQLPEYDDLWRQAFKYAPPTFMQAARETAKELGLLPETKYVNDAGVPVYSAEQIAEKLGIPVEQIEKRIQEQLADRLVVGNVHLVQ